MSRRILVRSASSAVAATGPSSLPTTLWNAVYLERAVTLLGKSQAVDTGLLQHLSPLGWEHVGLTGD
jgi:hypothetical protein